MFFYNFLLDIRNKSLIRIIIVVVIAVALFLVLRYLQSRDRNLSGLLVRENYSANANQNDRRVGVDATAGPGTTQTGEQYQPNNPSLIGGSKQSLYSASTDPGIKQLRSGNCFPKEQLTPNELLPQDNSTAWAQVNPQGSGTLKDRNFLQAGHHIGINTVGQTLRNANLQLRSEPPNPQVKVSPWIQSTIDPDTNRKPLEIGGCA